MIQIKNVISIYIWLFIFCTFVFKTSLAIDLEKVPQNEPPSIMEKALLRSLDNIILETMMNHGNEQLLEFGRIEEISGDNQYDVTLRVIGFEGAHNPPYTLIRMTIRFPGDEGERYTVLSYSHQPISPEEVKRLIPKN